MSADNITTCPVCKEPELREYETRMRIDREGNDFYLIVPEYRAECRACGWILQCLGSGTEITRRTTMTCTFGANSR